MNPDDIYRRWLELQQYVGWTEEDARRVRSVGATLARHLPALVEDFYAEIERHADTRKAITGGPAQIQRLKGALLSSLREMLSGPYDRDYVLRRWRIGQRHLELGLDQVYVQAALARLRAGLLRALAASWQHAWPPEGDAICRSLNLLLDLELAKIQDAYHRDHVHLVEEHTRAQGEIAFRALVEAAPCMVIIITAPDQTILYFNPFAEKVSGYPAIEVLGKNVAQLLNGQEYSAGLAWEQGTEFEGSICCKDGSRRWVVWNSERLSDFRGRPANLLVGLDRTELKEAQQRAWQTERLDYQYTLATCKRVLASSVG